MYYSNYIIKDNIRNNHEYLNEIVKSFIYLETAPTTYNIGFIKSLDDNNNYPFIETSNSIKLVYYEKEFYILKQKEIEYKEEIKDDQENIQNENIIQEDNEIIPEPPKEIINQEQEIIEE